MLNFSFVFAGVAGTNPAMILGAFGLILAWRNAGWYGLDRKLLPACGCPCDESIPNSTATTESPRATPSAASTSEPPQQVLGG